MCVCLCSECHFSRVKYGILFPHSKSLSCVFSERCAEIVSQRIRGQSGRNRHLTRSPGQIYRVRWVPDRSGRRRVFQRGAHCHALQNSKGTMKLITLELNYYKYSSDYKICPKKANNLSRPDEPFGSLMHLLLLCCPVG